MGERLIIVHPIKGSSHFLMRTPTGWDLSPDRADAFVFDDRRRAEAVRAEMVPAAAIMFADRVHRSVDGQLGRDGGRRT